MKKTATEEEVKPSDVFNHIWKTLIPYYGWTKKTYEDEKGRCCAVGWMALASGDCYIVQNTPLFQECARYFEKVIGPDETVIFCWNDKFNRTEAQVIEAFKKAEKLALADGR